MHSSLSEEHMASSRAKTYRGFARKQVLRSQRVTGFRYPNVDQTSRHCGVPDTQRVGVHRPNYPQQQRVAVEQVLPTVQLQLATTKDLGIND